MPLSAAEKQKRYRERLKEKGTYEKYKAKNCEQQRAHRYKVKEDKGKRADSENKEIQQQREQTRLRAAKFRALRKSNLENTKGSPAF